MAKIIGKELNIPFEEAKDNSVIWRYSKNPIIKRNPIEGISRIFNSAVVYFNNMYYGVFRAETISGIPYLYKGVSKDGINFTFDNKKIDFYNPDGSIYKFNYAYDPRVVEVEGEFYIIWCDGKDFYPSLGLAKTKDFEKFYMLDHPFLPFNRNGVLFPRKINNEYYMLSRPSDDGHTPFGDIFISRSKDLEYWGKHNLVMRRGDEWWQSLKIGPGPAPIETSEGWLIFYHGTAKTCNGFVYSVGCALLDINDPSKVLKRSSAFLLTPEEDYEVVGFVGNVCFPVACLADSKTGRIAIYYGASDTYTCLAFTTIDRVLEHLNKYGR